MARETDIRPTAAALYLLPVETRVPLKFGPETLTAVTCARVRVTVEDARGHRAEGWGETPLSVQWAWPSSLPYQEREAALVRFTTLLAEAWARFEVAGHPLEVGHAFQEAVLDPLLARLNAERPGAEPDDGYPVLLRDWVRRDGLKCLKVKLRGNDEAWDYQRLARVGRIAAGLGVEWLSADLNCTATDPAYVDGILDRLRRDDPRTWEMLLYVEQPFPYDLEANRIDVHGVSARKPLFMDESAHDWRLVRLGRELGWSGVALKTCKTQTGALLSLCWAKTHGMALMVQDLTNPMLAQVPHILLAAHAGTIMGVETNAMQFYPDVSLPEEAVHPGLYRRRAGELDLRSIRGPGLCYRLPEIQRALPPPAAAYSR